MATIVQYPARSGRRSELFLLILAILVGVGAYLSIMVSHPEAPQVWYWYCAAIAVGGIALHVAMRFLAPYADPVIMPVALALNGIGLAMISRLDLYYQQRADTTGSTAVRNAMLTQVNNERQVIFMVGSIAVVILTLLVFRDHRSLRKFAWPSLVVAILLMLSTKIPGLGQTVNGADISLRILGFTIQPNEFAKILLAIFFAGYLEYRRDSLAIAGKKIGFIQLPRWRDLLPILVVWAAVMGLLVLQKDLGVALLLFAIFVAVLYVATDRPSWIIFGGVLMIPMAVVAYLSFSHVQDRVTNWLHALDLEVANPDRVGGSWQLVNALFGMAYGGLTGTGWGLGRPGQTPLANSDFIVSSVAEEIGLTGMLAVMLLYLILVLRGLRAAMGVRDGFGKLLATALAFGIGAQLFIVAGGVTRLIPSTGLTAPFLAAGGVSSVANWLAVAILLRISDSARRPVPSNGTGGFRLTSGGSGDSGDSAGAAGGALDYAATERVVMPQ
ncbi:FtsW/RodA/SpoVE family cell cycle protein [uncultured Mobiluncus sp.]|uniref:FtsW/RodA/SpoVE family cell cycle protein n=1 Tax=uncultured Mobiluncus sp. TaxID=293425 RepID=UPI00261AAADB|nr:FtsW/RodA/SpoVE family cell cycle protein [uncultured Mobiluncus sp.]